MKTELPYKLPPFPHVEPMGFVVKDHPRYNFQFNSPSPYDWYGFEPVALRDDLEKSTVAQHNMRSICTFSQHCIRPGSTVFDIGASWGYYTMAFAHLVGPKGRVCFIEPDPDCFKSITDNIQLNQCKHIFGLQSICAATDALTLGLQHCVVVAPVDGIPSVNKVQTVSIDYLSGKEMGIKPDYIKIDVEGYELNVLQGAEETIKQVSPVFEVELHFHNTRKGVDMRKYGHHPLDLPRFFTDRGYYVFHNGQPLTEQDIIERFTPDCELEGSIQATPYADLNFHKDKKVAA